ncbi:hypothetical protein RclHR1_05880010 [Rhizophagus clarus]|uniref:DDE-1 domain-containing protein n=1 Tax=Rhizophagus clarus TaxID=94130 RepID=A0A2Z6SGN4_9GLOM|nr:hypothetical protein RclHR1_05880010 [Rhizophagus clarus]
MDVNETQEKLDSIDIKFLPPNTTIKLQPCDAGIIYSFKCYYKRLFIQNRIDAYDDMQDGIKKTGILPPSINETGEIPDDDLVFSNDSFNMDIDKLEALIFQLLKSDLSVYKYLHIENKMPEGGLTDFEIVDTIQNANKEEEDISDEIEFTPILEKVSLTDTEKTIDKTMKFLYEQGSEFGDVNEELKVLRKLHKKVKVLVVKNFRQVDLHYFQYR